MVENRQGPGQQKDIRRPFRPLASLQEHLLIILAVTVLGAGLSIVTGIKVGKPIYVAEAILNVNPTIPKILYRTEDTLMVRSYEDWMRTQVNVISSYPILEAALAAYQKEGFRWQRPGESDRAAVARLGEKLKVKQIRDTQLITLSMSSRNITGLAEMVNAVITAYLHSQRKEQLDDDSLKIKRLGEEREKIKRELDKSYQELERISSKYGTAITEEKNLYAYIDSLADLKKTENAAFLNRINLDHKIKSLKKKGEELKTTDISAQVRERVAADTVLQDNLIQNERRQQDLRAQLVKLKEINPQYQSIKDRLGTLHGQTEELQASTYKRHERLLGEKIITENEREQRETQAQYEVAVKAEAEIHEKLKKLQREVLEYNTAVLKASPARQEIERLQASLNRINERIDQILIEWANPGRIHVVSWALPPERPTSEDRMKIILIGLLASFLLGCGIVLGIDFLDKTIQRPGDIQNILGFPATGFLLDSGEDRIPDRCVYSIFKDYPQSFVYEQYRGIALHVQNDHEKHGSTVFTLVSVNDGNGATSVAINVLSLLDVPAGRKLHIDLNFRNPLRLRVPEAAHWEGLTEWAETGGDIVPCIHGSENFPFLLLPLGGKVDSASSAFSFSKMKPLIEALRSRFDYVFIDGPPLLVSQFSHGAASLADVVVLVAQAGSTQWEDLIHGVNLLDRLGVKVISIVLNRVRLLRSGNIRKAMDKFYGRPAGPSGFLQRLRGLRTLQFGKRQ